MKINELTDEQKWLRYNFQAVKVNSDNDSDLYFDNALLSTIQNDNNLRKV